MWGPMKRRKDSTCKRMTSAVLRQKEFSSLNLYKPKARVSFASAIVTQSHIHTRHLLCFALFPLFSPLLSFPLSLSPPIPSQTLV